MVDEFSYEKNGDKYEVSNWKFAKEFFPNHEIFWKKFVVPTTKRVEGVVGTEQILPRDNVPDDLIDLAQIHYSIFVALCESYRRRSEISDAQSNEIFGTEILRAAFFRLGNSTELIEHFFYKLSLLLHPFESTHKLTEEEFNFKKSDYTFNKYENDFDEWKTKFNHKPNVCFVRNDWWKTPYIEKILDKKCLQGMKTRINEIRQYRNCLAHRPVMLVASNQNGELLIPKPDKINKLSMFKSRKESFSSEDFAVAKDLLEDFISSLCRTVNGAWAKILQDEDAVCQAYNGKYSCFQKGRKTNKKPREFIVEVSSGSTAVLQRKDLVSCMESLSGRPDNVIISRGAQDETPASASVQVVDKNKSDKE